MLVLKKTDILALIAQLDRALDYGSKGWGFDSLWVHQIDRKLELRVTIESDLSKSRFCDIMDMSRKLA